MRTAITALLFLIQWGAWALPESGLIKELGESPVSDEALPLAEAKGTGPLSTSSESPTVYGQLDPFDEVAILQRKYIPKKNRFELGVAYGALVDNAFHDNQGFYGRLGYSIIETLGIEVFGI